MLIRLGKKEGLGQFGAVGEDLGEFVFERLDDEPDLVFVDDIPIQLACRVGQVVVEFFVFGGLGASITVGNKQARLLGQSRPVPRDFCFDGVDIKTDVHLVQDSLFMAVVLNEVSVEEADGLLGGCRR